jgi:hypothetical protein
MGKCLRLAGQIPQINIQLPGGAKLGSIPNQTQTHPNALDPAGSLMAAASPALAAIRPAIDIVAFIVALVQIYITTLTIMGALATFMGAVGNPISLLFPVPNVKDENGDELEPPVPDVGGFLTKMLDEFFVLICRALKLVGLVPQLSAVATIKDSLVTALQLMDAVQGEINSTLDRIQTIIPASTGDPLVDGAIECAQERLSDALGGKLGILSSLMPVMDLIQVLVDIVAQPLPRVIFTMSELAIEAGIIVFPNDESKEIMLDILDEMTTNGLPIDIPDFGDISDLVEKMQEIKDKLDPLLPVIETIQVVVNKLTNC